MKYLRKPLKFKIFILGIPIYALIKIFCFDYFYVKTSSMYPAIKKNSIIIINKFTYGARLYKSFFIDSNNLQCYRVSGLSHIKRNNIIVFNYHLNSAGNKISFNLNKIYIKRCIGLPGDSISIIDSYYKVNGYNITEGNIEMQSLLSKSNDESFINLRAVPYGYSTNLKWTIKNWGPFYIPKINDCINLNKINYTLYKPLIEYETGKSIALIDDNLILDEKEIISYKFLKNYYFVGGDNVFDSYDSRYFGVIPEDFIIGKLCIIL